MFVDVIPILDNLRNEFIGLRDVTENDVLDIVQVASQAALMMVDKYSLFTTDCDIYQFAIVLCPDWKLKWFKDHGFPASKIKDIKKCILARFTQSYATDKTSQPNVVQQVKKRSPFVIHDSSATSTAPLDHFQTYLSEPIILSFQIQDAGGYLKWWANARCYFYPCITSFEKTSLTFFKISHQAPPGTFRVPSSESKEEEEYASESQPEESEPEQREPSISPLPLYQPLPPEYDEPDMSTAQQIMEQLTAQQNLITQLQQQLAMLQNQPQGQPGPPGPQGPPREDANLSVVNIPSQIDVAKPKIFSGDGKELNGFITACKIYLNLKMTGRLRWIVEERVRNERGLIFRSEDRVCEPYDQL
ncbi:hypothetical protein Agabi119p4_9136 [Agaricus bisporus var. burnettii]|uniref:Uncharacterized protein n=1 Tax=Agaricus bisporus var. burnettii TaxID=192524 RepID=A0A8H7C5S0_AGABI|nr:hypothetical protein Agabi119p4_9136 [Agaricus bisporus var. burnettii]